MRVFLIALLQVLLASGFAALDLRLRGGFGALGPALGLFVGAWLPQWWWWRRGLRVAPRSLAPGVALVVGLASLGGVLLLARWAPQAVATDPGARPIVLAAAFVLGALGGGLSALTAGDAASHRALKSRGELGGISAERPPRWGGVGGYYGNLGGDRSGADGAQAGPDQGRRQAPRRPPMEAP